MPAPGSLVVAAAVGLAGVAMAGLSIPADMADRAGHGAASPHQAAVAGGHHDAGEHDHTDMLSLASGPGSPTVSATIAPDPAGGWNLVVETTNFRFTPEGVNGPHVDGEGHAHLYVNGQKAARLYAPWHHVSALPENAELTVSLNANDHRTLAVEGTALVVPVALRPVP